MIEGKRRNLHWIVIAAGGGLLLLDLLFYFVFLTPLQNAYASRVSEREQVVDSLQQKRAAVNKLTAIQAHLRDSSGNEAKRFENHLWNVDDGFSSLIQMFSDLSHRTAVEKGRVTFKSANQPVMGFMQVQADVPVQGTYPDLVKFINALERSDKLLIIDSIALLTGQGNSGLLRLNLSLLTYFRTS